MQVEVLTKFPVSVRPLILSLILLNVQLLFLQGLAAPLELHQQSLHRFGRAGPHLALANAEKLIALRQLPEAESLDERQYKPETTVGR